MKTVGAVGGEQLLAMLKSARSVGWDWDLKTGRDLWFGDLPTLFGMPGDTYVGRPEDFHRFLHPDDCANSYRSTGSVIRKQGLDR